MAEPESRQVVGSRSRDGIEHGGYDDAAGCWVVIVRSFIEHGGAGLRSRMKLSGMGRCF